MLWRKAVFIILVIFCLSPLGSPQLAVVLGAVFGLTLGNPFPQLNARTRELLLKASIVLLAFGTDLSAVYRAFKDGALFVAAAVAAFLLFVYLLGRLLRINGAFRLVANAENVFSENEDGHQFAKSLTAALMVSAIGLIGFPHIGRYFHLNANQVGIWSAMAIPGPAFVAGSAATFKPDATAAAIPLALTATLLIAIVALISRQRGNPLSKASFPWFAPLFLLAVGVRTYAPVSIFPSIFDSVVNLGNAGIVVGLFFVGAGISRPDIKNSSTKQFIQVFLPWLLVSAASLWAVLHLL